MTKEQLETLREFATDNGAFRCNGRQAAELASALTAALAELERDQDTPRD